MAQVWHQTPIDSAYLLCISHLRKYDIGSVSIYRSGSVVSLLVYQRDLNQALYPELAWYQ